MTKQINVQLNNWKLLSDYKADLSGSFLYLVCAKNERGKSSFIGALKSIMNAKIDVKEPVTKGQSEGSMLGELPGADGNIYQVKVDFTNEKAKFVLLDSDGNSISKVTDIRKLFNYLDMTVEEFFEYSKTAEGRRKQRELFLNYLTTDQRKAYDLAQDKETVSYSKRTEKGRELDVLKKQVQANSLTEEDLKKLEAYDKASSRLSEMRSQLSGIEVLESKRSSLVDSKNRVVADFDALLLDVKEYEESVKLLNKSKNAYVTLIDAKINGIEIPNKAELRDSVAKGEEYVRSLDEIRSKKVLYDNAKSQLDKTQEYYNKLDKDVEDARKEKQKIVKESNIPIKGLEIDDDGITVDGFRFDENQICTSKGIKIVTSLMATLSDCPIILIGRAESLDNDSLQELYNIGMENDKAIIAEKVMADGDEVTIVAYEDLK